MRIHDIPELDTGLLADELGQALGRFKLSSGLTFDIAKLSFTFRVKGTKYTCSCDIFPTDQLPLTGLLETPNEQ